MQMLIMFGMMMSFAVEDMKKYGWEAKHNKGYRGAIDLW